MTHRNLHNVHILCQDFSSSFDTSLSIFAFKRTFKGTWSATGSMSITRHWHTASILQNGSILVVAGSISGLYYKSAEIYDVQAGMYDIELELF